METGCIYNQFFTDYPQSILHFVKNVESQMIIYTSMFLLGVKHPNYYLTSVIPVLDITIRPSF